MSGEGIFRLSDGDLHAEIWPELGGRIAGFFSLRDGERFDWMVPAPAGDIEAGRPGSWGSFPLVPFSNRIRDARFEWEGETVRIEANEKGAANAIHGHGRSRPWSLDGKTGRSVRLSYSYAGGDWPFPYRAEQDILLEGGRLVLRLRLTNEGVRPMPAGLGHHPYFPWRDGPVIKTRFAQYWPAVDGVLPAGPEPLPDALDFLAGRTLPRGLDTGFSGWDGELSLSWPAQEAAMLIEGSDRLGHMIVFSPPGQDFFCAEPVTHSIDAVNLAARGLPDTGICALGPGECLAVETIFRPSF